MPRQESSIYKGGHPPGSRVLLKFSPNELTLYDRLVVGLSSLFFVGGVFWVPAIYAWAWRRFQFIPKKQRKRRAIYAAFLVAATALFVAGPHRNRCVGGIVKVHQWSLWKSWLRFFAFEVVADNYDAIKDLKDKQAIVAISPHGIFPFGLAFAALSETSREAFGEFRAVVASATQMIPWVRDVLRWVHAVDASRPAVDRALREGSRIGLAPGGIAEMFEGYPKHLAHPDEEFTIVRRGIFRMAIQHSIPIIPVYCFGSTKIMKRLQLPAVIEKISVALRVSLVIFFGRFGLPLPFRQRLMYIMGVPIDPMSLDSSTSEDQQVDEMFKKYCEEMVRIFDRHKESYGWAHKSLTTIPR